MMNKLLPIMVAVIAVIIVMAIYWDTDTILHNQYDDSYITYRYAVKLASGKGLVYNSGERADGASSFLYTVILAGLYKIGFHNLELVSFIINMIAVGMIAGFVYNSGIRTLGGNANSCE